MAGLRTLLRYARLSDRRSRASRRIAAEKAVGWTVVAVAVYAFCRQVWAVVEGSALAAKILVVALAAAWILLPSGVLPTMPARRLAWRPVTKAQIAAFRILSILQNPQSVVVLVASMVSVLAMAFLSHPFRAMAEAAGALIVAASVGVGCAIVLEDTRSRGKRRTGDGNPIRSRAFPLIRKECRCYLRTLDFYLAMVISGVVALSEAFGGWMTPAKATIPLLLLALLQIPALLNPFGLETPSQLDRCRLLPVAYWKLVLRKHVVLVVLYLLSAVPMMAALMYRVSFGADLEVLGQLCLVVVSWLVTGVLLMRLPSSRQIRMRFGAFSGNNMSAFLVLVAAALLVIGPSVAELGMHSLGTPAGYVVALGIFGVSIFAYVGLLRREDWGSQTAD